MPINAECIAEGAAHAQTLLVGASREKTDKLNATLYGLRIGLNALDDLGADTATALAAIKDAEESVEQRRAALRRDQLQLIAARAEEAGIPASSLHLEPCVKGDRIAYLARSAESWINYKTRDEGEAVQVADESGILGIVDAHETALVEDELRFGAICSIPISEIAAAGDHDDGIEILTYAGRHIKVSVSEDAFVGD